jgi:bifunctional DNA-binding transcriptional regulator/antitoxin component of YhaV-PrlF toxin-antitoxin module
MYSSSVKITDKGQVTIPKEVRNALGSNIICFEISQQGKVMINPVKSVYGMLNEYSTNQGSFTNERNVAWKKVADEWQE